MSKVAEYLNEHLLGEVTAVTSIRRQYASDGSAVAIVPELVIFPRVTNDIRKVARFSWQLAEKGHVMSIVPRGAGTDPSGGAVGAGILITTAAYLDNILYISGKEKTKIVHVQPGVSVEALQQALKWQGYMLGALKYSSKIGTIGGAVASGYVGPAAGKYGSIGDMIERLEVVLANGDLIETGRVSRRDVERKKGLQTLEGEIYRQIDGIIEDSQDIIAQLNSSNDNTGYRIDQVKGKDGSIDLTPLFIGSQGTLGIISEAVLKVDYYSDRESALVAVTSTFDEARDIADIIAGYDPSMLRIISSETVDAARRHGKKYIFNDDGEQTYGAVVYASFDDFSDSGQTKKLKKITKQLEKSQIRAFTSDDTPLVDLQAIRDIEVAAALPQKATEQRISVCAGAFVPGDRFAEFSVAAQEFAAKHRITLPLQYEPLTGIVSTSIFLGLSKIADKQKVFKLSSEFAALVRSFGGTLAGESAEGRLGAFAEYGQLSSEVANLYTAIRMVFDPFGTLNPGVKQATDLKVIAKQLKNE